MQIGSFLFEKVT